MILTGKLSREHFAGPTWVLDATDGARYELIGALDEALVDQVVTVEGHADEQAFGFAMVGTRFVVERVVEQGVEPSVGQGVEEHEPKP